MTRREMLAALAVGSASEPYPHLLMDLTTKRVLEARWPAPDTPIPFGSLMKPFVALTHGPPYPEVVCTGCWKPDGHGRLSLPESIAQSCNVYFLAIGRECSPDAIARTSAIYGMPPPTVQTPEAWIGLGTGWSVSPIALLRAYCEIGIRRAEAVLKGMRLSAQHGTARAIGRDAFAKTGTAPCSHKSKGTGDGYTVALFPAESPRYALLVGAHDKPGSETARIAGDLTRKIMPTWVPRKVGALSVAPSSHSLPRL